VQTVNGCRQFIESSQPSLETEEFHKNFDFIVSWEALAQAICHLPSILLLCSINFTHKSTHKSLIPCRLPLQVSIPHYRRSISIIIRYIILLLSLSHSLTHFLINPPLALMIYWYLEIYFGNRRMTQSSAFVQRRRRLKRLRRFSRQSCREEAAAHHVKVPKCCCSQKAL